MFWGRELSMVIYNLYLYCQNKALKVEKPMISI